MKKLILVLLLIPLCVVLFGGTHGVDLNVENVVIVNPGTDKIQSAIDGIIDESATKRYTVLLNHGRHVLTSGINMAQYIDLIGYGKSSEIYSDGVDDLITIASDTKIGNFTVTYDNLASADEIMNLEAGGNATNILISDIIFDVDCDHDDGIVLDLNLNKGKDMTVRDCRFNNTNGSVFGTGIKYGQTVAGWDCNIVGNIFDDFHKAVFINLLVQPTVNVFDNMMIDGDYGIYVYGSAAVVYYCNSGKNWSNVTINPFYSHNDNALGQINWSTFDDQSAAGFTNNGTGTHNITYSDWTTAALPLNESSGTADIGGLAAYGGVGQVMRVAAGGASLEWSDQVAGTTPIGASGGTVSIGGLAAYGAAGEAMVVNATTDGLQWGGVGGHVPVTDSLRGTDLGDTCVIYVQPGQAIATAISGIGDEAVDKPYVVVLRAGRHTITSELVMAQYISLKGEGRESTMLYTSSALSPMVRLASNAIVADMTIYHDGASGDDQPIFDTNGAGTTSTWIINCELRHDNATHDGGVFMDHTISMTDFKMLNCYLVGDDTASPEGEAIYIGVTGTAAQPIVIKDCVFENWHIGIRRYNPTTQYGFQCDNNVFTNCANQAFYTRTSYSTTFHEYMSNCAFYNNGTDIYVFNESGGTFNFTVQDMGDFTYGESGGTANVVFKNYIDQASYADENGIRNIVGPYVSVPNAASNAGVSVADDGAITVTAKLMRVVGADADAVLDTDPAINDGIYDGQEAIIQGTADGNLVTIHDNVNTQLDGGANCALGDGDMLYVIWDSNYSMWCEVSRSNN